MTIYTDAKAIKRRADSVLEEVFLSLFEEIDVDRLKKEVEEMHEASPGFRPAQHARTLARRTAIRCAAAGAVTGIPMGLAAIATLGADLAYLMYQQFRLILGIAAIYGHDLSNRERFAEAAQCFAYTTGVGVGKEGIAVATRLLRERMARLIPVVGVISGGALNYMSVYAVARTAIRYYESRVDDTLAEEIWAEGDREHA